MNETGNAARRVLVVGSDADISLILHSHLERAGCLLYCLPWPGQVESLLPVVAPHVIVLLLPQVPDRSWTRAMSVISGNGLSGALVVAVVSTAQVVEELSRARSFHRVVLRSEVLVRPLSLLERPRTLAPEPDAEPVLTGELIEDELEFEAPVRPPAPARAMGKKVELAALIDEELLEAPSSRPRMSSADPVEAGVSLVSENNFYVGATRSIDSGGVFIATNYPLSLGASVQVILILADGRKVQLSGQVAWVRQKEAMMGRQPGGYGVKLFGMPGWAVEAIERFIKARTPIRHIDWAAL